MWMGVRFAVWRVIGGEHLERLGENGELQIQIHFVAVKGRAEYGSEFARNRPK